MSFANYQGINPEGQVQFTQPSIYLNGDPDDIDDGARLADTLTQVGNGTQPEGLSGTITSTGGFQAILISGEPAGVLEQDYLRIIPPVFNPNFAQLAQVSYKLDIPNHSTEKFEVRQATQDASLNRVNTYQALVFDPSVNTLQPKVIDSLTVNGQAVDYSDTAVQGFLEFDILDGGALSYAFNQANSNLETALDTSVETGQVGSRPSTNLFNLELTQFYRDVSGVEKDLTILEGKVAALEAEADTLSDDKLNIDGSIAMTGNLNLGGNTITNVSTFTATGLRASGDIIVAGNGGRITSDLSQFYIQSGTGSNIEIINFTKWADSSPSARIDTSSGELLLQGKQGGGGFNIGDTIVANAGEITTLSGRISSNTTAIGGNTTAISQRLPLSGGTMTGVINTGGNKITGLPTPTAVTDATPKTQVDTNVATRLPLSGGTMTGNLNLGSNSLTAGTINQTALNPAPSIQLLTEETFTIPASGTISSGAVTLTSPLHHITIDRLSFAGGNGTTQTFTLPDPSTLIRGTTIMVNVTRTANIAQLKFVTAGGFSGFQAINWETNQDVAGQNFQCATPVINTSVAVGEFELFRGTSGLNVIDGFIRGWGNQNVTQQNEARNSNWVFKFVVDVDQFNPTTRDLWKFIPIHTSFNVKQ